MSTSLQIVILLLVAYVAVFLTTQFGAIKSVLGAQVDPLPSLLVYCGLRTGLMHVFIVAVVGGLWMDALSANPLGTSILPLFLVGSFVNRQQDLILRQEAYAQFVLGCFASGLAPLAALSILFSKRSEAPGELGIALAVGYIDLGWRRVRAGFLLVF